MTAGGRRSSWNAVRQRREHPLGRAVTTGSNGAAGGRPLQGGQEAVNVARFLEEHAQVLGCRRHSFALVAHEQRVCERPRPGLHPGTSGRWPVEMRCGDTATYSRMPRASAGHAQLLGIVGITLGTAVRPSWAAPRPRPSCAPAARWRTHRWPCARRPQSACRGPSAWT